MCVYVSRDDVVVVLVCGTSWMTGSCRGCSCRSVHVFTLTHGCFFLDHRNQRSAHKHRDVVLPHCRTLRPTLCVTTGFPVSSRCEHDWSPQASTPSPETMLSHHRPGLDNLHLPVLLLLGCAAMPALAAPQPARNQSAVAGLSDGLSPLRRNTAVRLNIFVAHQFCTPS